MFNYPPPLLQINENEKRSVGNFIYLISMKHLTTEQLIEKHIDLVSSNKLDNIYSLRMEINKRTGYMDWENNYKYLDLKPNKTN